MSLESRISLAPAWQNRTDVLRVVEVADDAGLDLVGIRDHPYQWRFHVHPGPGEPS